MSDLNHTPNSERMQIGFFGRVNAGKSSLFNLLTGQELAVVSDKEGTTTDPVKKAMELLPIGPVMLYDTPGLLDESTLGAKRLKKTDEILRRIDIAIVVADAKSIISEDTKNSIEKKFIEDLKEKNIPYFFVLNKIESIKRDELDSLLLRIKDDWGVKKEYIFEISCISPDSAERAYALRERIAFLGKASQNKERHLVSDIIKQGDIIILVIPIDESAPKGRIILPQQQVIRDALNVGAIPMAVHTEELSDALSALKNPPALVITDSQAFSQVEKIVPESIPLTSFSILMARYKGDLEWQAKGALSIDKLPCGACILISEGCTHHRQCGDKHRHEHQGVGAGAPPAPEFPDAPGDGRFVSDTGELVRDVAQGQLVVAAPCAEAFSGFCTNAPRAALRHLDVGAFTDTARGAIDFATVLVVADDGDRHLATARRILVSRTGLDDARGESCDPPAVVLRGLLPGAWKMRVNRPVATARTLHELASLDAIPLSTDSSGALALPVPLWTQARLEHE